MNIYVGNLPYNLTDDELRQAFEAYGKVTSAKVINDRETGQPRGFAFVEMAERGEAEAAIKGLNGADLKGRNLKVNEARPREGGPGGGGGGGGGGGRRDRHF